MKDLEPFEPKTYGMYENSGAGKYYKVGTCINKICRQYLWLIRTMSSEQTCSNCELRLSNKAVNIDASRARRATFRTNR